MVMDRMENGASSTSPSIFQLYGRYGGGKTHGMLVVAAAALHPRLNYWEETAQTKASSARVVAFNGENSSPTTGINLDDQGLRAKSLAGYLLFQLGGAEALHQFHEGDERLTDPGRGRVPEAHWGPADSHNDRRAGPLHQQGQTAYRLRRPDQPGGSP